MENNDKLPLPFLGKVLQLTKADRSNPTILLMLSQIERTEIDKKDGFVWYTHLRDNYGLRLERDLEKQLQDILMG